MRKHQDVVEMRERFRPISGLPTFARVKNAGRTEVKEVLSDEVINMLVMQLFSEAHLDSALQAMQKETGMKCMSFVWIVCGCHAWCDVAPMYITNDKPDTPGAIESESLQTLLKVGIETELKDLFAPPVIPEDSDPEVEAFRTYVFDSGGITLSLSSFLFFSRLFSSFLTYNFLLLS